MGETNRDLRLVIDLESYLEQNPGIHPIVTGTFDPPHIQHTAPLLGSLEELERRGITNPFLLVAHSRNTDKTPVATLSERREWLLDTVDFFADKVAHRVKLCVGMGEPNEPYLYNLPIELQKRLLRIAGSDKGGKIKNGHIDTFFVQRGIDMSSTRVRELMKLTGSHPDLTLALAPKVLTDILAREYYRKAA